MKMNKILLEMNEEELKKLIIIFEYYLQSCSKGSDMHYADFIYQFMRTFLSDSDACSFCQKQQEIRKDHINWLIHGDCGEDEPHVKIPTNYQELKEMLLKYDMCWLGKY